MGSNGYDESEEWSERSPVDHVHGVWYQPRRQNVRLHGAQHPPRSGYEIETRGDSTPHVIDDISATWRQMVSDVKSTVGTDATTRTGRSTVSLDDWYEIDDTDNDAGGLAASTLRQRAALLIEQAGAMVARADALAKFSSLDFEVGDVVIFERKPDSGPRAYTYAAILCDNGRWYVTGRATPTSGLDGTTALAAWVFRSGYTVLSMHKMKKGDQIL